VDFHGTDYWRLHRLEGGGRETEGL
jgi:colicin import membrane protein